MPITVSIADILHVFDLQNEHSSSYMNKHTGVIETISDFDSTGDELSPEELEGDDYLPLPTSFDIHEYEIMRDFCRSVEDPKLSTRLQNAISGPGAFRYFKDTIHEHGIADR